MQKTKIEYLTHTWNPIAMRCTPVSAGCANCWHLTMAKRLAGNPKVCNEFKNAYSGIIPPVLIHAQLEAPLLLRRPARIGVQFMGDLFHGAMFYEHLNSIFSVMQDTGRHDFFILTKRPEKMVSFLRSQWPVLNGNIWLGVSIEDQKTADERIPILFKISAAHYWISHEPGIGIINYSKIRRCSCGNFVSALLNQCPHCQNRGLRAIDFLVTGGETGSGARPMNPDIPIHDRDQCHSAGVPFFFKGWGEWLPVDQIPKQRFETKKTIQFEKKNGFYFWRIGHKKTGYLLDGKEWREI